MKRVLLFAGLILTLGNACKPNEHEGAGPAHSNASDAGASHIDAGSPSASSSGGGASGGPRRFSLRTSILEHASLDGLNCFVGTVAEAHINRAPAELPLPNYVVRFDQVENICHPGRELENPWFGILLSETYAAQIEESGSFPPGMCTSVDGCLAVGMRAFLLSGPSTNPNNCRGLEAAGCSVGDQVDGVWNERPDHTVRTAYERIPTGLVWEDATLGFADFTQGVRNVVAGIDRDAGCARTGCPSGTGCLFGAACTEIRYNGTNPDRPDAGRPPLEPDAGPRPLEDGGPPNDGGR